MAPTFVREREYRDGPVTIPIKVYAQCAGAEIDLFANMCTTIFSQAFKISVKGQRHINTALANLPVYDTADEFVTFGWAREHALRNRGLAVHEGGYEHIALEGALGEGFPEPYVARVLMEVATANAVFEDGDITPHLRQWRNFVRSSDGIFATTDFGLLVGKYVRLFPTWTSHVGSKGFSAAPTPKQFAEVMTAVASVSQSADKSVLVHGGPVLGWIAAVVDWLLDLPFKICEAGGKCLFGEGITDAKVVFVYQDSNSIGFQMGASGQVDDTASSKIEPKMVGEQPERFSRTPFSGRVAWNQLFSQVFGSSFAFLQHEEHTSLAVSLGCAARVLIGAEGEPSSNGLTLVHTLTTWFPELYRFQGRMEHQMKLSHTEARSTFGQRMQRVRDACGCSICFTSKSNRGPGQGSYCLTTLIDTMLTLGFLLSHLTVAPQLYPTRHGIQSLYMDVAARKRNLYMRAPHYPSDMADFITLFAPVRYAPIPIRLQICIQVFSMSTSSSYNSKATLPQNLVALSEEGICAYLLRLEKHEDNVHPFGHDKHLEIIRVVSGGINWRYKVFRRACLGPADPSESDDLEDYFEEVPAKHFKGGVLYCQ